MKRLGYILKLNAALLLALAPFTGCESTDGGGSAQVSGGMYYGVGFYDPWYYGDYNNDITITPPPGSGRPPGDRPGSQPRPEQPIARPPAASAPRPMPSIPSAPRGMSGGGRR